MQNQHHADRAKALNYLTSHIKVLYKKVVLKNVKNSQGNACVGVSLFISIFFY